MISLATPDFWACYNALPEDIRRRADTCYELWRENPRHPSLQFMRKGEWWSVRVTDDYRALGDLDGDTMTWFFIGTHAEYLKMLK
jgi:hypothetical protein